ncbi:MAG: glycosyltransferase family 1 protein [Planctomycetes bacterium]|jgi:glycosyltransferase involved in cell wall biosynthesis|nr:glycosyltransferase family 1 protein [Planctomycetota bacterium]
MDSLQPQMSDIGVIGLVPDQWQAPWMPRHHVMSRLAKYFRVAWLNPRLSPRDKLDAARLHSSGLEQPQGMQVIQPGCMLAHLGRYDFLRRMLQRQRLKGAARLLSTTGCRRIILYVWRPEFEPALDMISHDLSCYHIDDEYTFADQEQPMSEVEARLLARVNQVFIHSPGLMAKKGGINPNTQYVSNGVDYPAYSFSAPEPDDLAKVPRPRIGYVGYIKRQLDLDLLLALARKHSNWSYVLVGPVNESRLSQEELSVLDSLKKMTNVYFLGGKTVPELPAYVQHMDVCLLPYRVNDYTKFIYPLKLHEYLATGRPVVGSMIRTLKEYADVVRLAADTDDWSDAITDALRPAANAPALVAHRRSVASKYDWNLLVAEIAHTLCLRLGSEYAERFEKLRLDFDSRVHVKSLGASGQSCKLSMRQKV